MLRRFFLTLLTYPATVLAKESRLPYAHDLQLVAKQSLAKRQPLVLLASLPGCPYCELVRRNYLAPYAAEQGLSSWQLDTTDAVGQLVDFAGKKTTPSSYLKALRIKVTPTLLFLNAQGIEIAPRLEGMAVPDFYGAYLDERLATAKRQLR